MREIKFRVWDTKSESIEYEIAIGKGYGEDSYILFLGLGETFIIDDDIVKIMQYTGLKDKNAVGIYEGDIVTHEDFKLPSEVTFERGCFRIHGFTIANFEAIHHMDKIQVIGNIYENPDLLKG